VRGDGWESWWKGHGRERLEFLLWAVWDPIGGGLVPFDEYASYCEPLVQILRQCWEDDEQHAERPQSERNAAWQQEVEMLAARLSQIRFSRMGVEGNLETDRRAAEKLIDWYDWEMDGLAL
jgi:hypothetical protein